MYCSNTQQECSDSHDSISEEEWPFIFAFIGFLKSLSEEQKQNIEGFIKALSDVKME